jgi:hypothetical protein
MITPWRAMTERALIVAGLLLSFFVLPHEIISDAMVRYLALAELVEWHKVSPMAYSFIGPLFSAPLYFAGKLVMTPDWWCARFNTTVLATGLLVMWLTTRGRIDAGLRRKFFLVLLAASMFPNHLRGYFTEVFSSVMVAVGFWAVRFGRPGLGWSAVTLGVVNMPATLLALTLATVRHVWESKRLRHLLVIALTVALWLLESWMRRGHPTFTGYQGNNGPRTVLPYSGLPGFSYPLFFGLLSVLLSFGKGLLFFVPGLLLPSREWMHDELKGVHRLWLWFLAGMILVYASWWAWFGGWFWGPRFFLFACFPASLAIAVRLQQVDRLPLSAVAATLGVLTLSAWVGLSGAGFDQSDLIHSCTPETEFLCWYVPEFSALWYPFVTNWRPGANAFVMMGYCLAVYLWLAAPLMRALATKATPHLMRVVRENATAGWRF